MTIWIWWHGAQACPFVFPKRTKRSKRPKACICWYNCPTPGVWRRFVEK